MNDRTATLQTRQSRKKVIGDYLHKIEDIPIEAREYTINKLNPVDEAGKRIKDNNENPITARISTAKENGSYYGPVILNNEQYLIQAIGKKRLSAVVHRKEDIALQGASLGILDAKKTMNGTNVQIHYSGDKAKVYHWVDKRRETEQAKTPAEKALAKEPMKAEDFMHQSTEYAKSNISAQAFDKQQPQLAKVKTDTGIER